LDSIFSTIFLLAATQGFLLAALLFFKRTNKHANRVLSVAILILSFDLLITFLFFKKLYLQYPIIFGANFALPFIYGPIFFVYTKIVTGGEEKFRTKYLIHFLPFVIIHLYGIQYYILSNEEKLKMINYYLVDVQPGFLIIGFLRSLSGMTYTILSLSLIKKFDKKLLETFSNIDKLKLSWLKFLITGTLFVWIARAIMFVISAIYHLDKAPYDGINYFFVSVLIYTIGYGALNQSDVFNYGKDNTGDDAPVQSRVTLKSIKYERSSLGEADIHNIKNDLVRLMEKEKLFLNPELTLTELANRLLITNHNLSEVINTSFSKNFYDFINSYRVEEFKERIKNPEYANYSLLAVAYDSGFSSKSSFNSIFKKHTGSTPSEYRKQIPG
jgi:AraC-like DNA-binding protein